MEKPQKLAYPPLEDCKNSTPSAPPIDENILQSGENRPSINKWEPIPPPADEEMEISEEDMLLNSFKEFLQKHSFLREELVVVKRNFAKERKEHRRTKRHVNSLESDLKEAAEIVEKTIDIEKQLKDAETEIRRLSVYEKCCVCMDREKNIVLLPCQHYIMCEQCADKSGQRENVCPVCRTEVRGFISGVKNV